MRRASEATSLEELVVFALDKYRDALIAGVPQKLARYQTLKVICKAVGRDPTLEANRARKKAEK